MNQFFAQATHYFMNPSTDRTWFARLRSYFTRFAVLTSFSLSLGCGNADPTITSFFSSSLNSPTSSSGDSEWSQIIQDPTSSLIIGGKCDPQSLRLELSIDGGITWTSALGNDTDCTDKNFSLTLDPSTLGFVTGQSMSTTVQIRQVSRRSNSPLLS